MAMEIIISVVLLFFGIAILVIIHVCVVGRAFRNDPNNTSNNSVERRAIRIPGMKMEDIKEIPCLEYKFEEQEEVCKINGECMVCLENFKTGEKCKILPKCNHCFHAVCIDSWLLKTGACPICRSIAKLPNMEECSSSFSGEGVELV